MEPQSYILPVSFPTCAFAEPMSHYRFRVIPKAGDEVVGCNAVFRVVKLIHQGGLNIEDEPEVTVELAFVRNIPMPE